MNLSNYKLFQSPSRNDLIKKFVDRINSDRKFDKLKPLPFVVFVGKLKHLDDYTIEAFYRDCDNSKNFSRMFWGLLKNK